MHSSRYPSNIFDWPPIYIHQNDFRPKLINIANAITNLKLWDRLLDFPNNDCHSLIKKNVINDNHTEFTFDYSMRCMENIKRNGFDSFEKEVYSYYLKN